MKSINEFIGNIEGINFDGIVNSREVLKLQSWLEQNRNLVFIPEQMQLLNLVEQVLDDGVITEQERLQLVQYAEDYQNQQGKYIVTSYELNGIIEGIICDGIVNEQEVYNLKKWMDEKGSSLKSDKSCAKLCEIVDEILEDGIVTEEEQMQLLDVLSERIKNFQFETKLNALRKMVSSKKNIGFEIIDILDDDKSIEKIHMRAESELARTLSSYTCCYVSDPEVVFISLVLIAMLDYDGNYYDNVQATYPDLYEKHSEQKVEGLIRSIINKYRTSTSTSNSRMRIINEVLKNAIVPIHYLASFFDFIYDIYLINFDSNLSDHLYEDFCFIYEGLKNQMNEDNDVFSVTVTKKSYKLINSTKRLIAQGNQLDSIIKLSIVLIKIIDKRVWKKELKIYNPYLKEGYNSWESTYKINESAKGNHLTKARWIPQFLFENDSIYLEPPIHRIDPHIDFRGIRICIYNNESLIYCEERPMIKEIFGGYEVSTQKIKIDYPLDNLSYKIECFDEVIYDSVCKLYREFIAFDLKGSEVKNNTNYSGNLIFCYKGHSEGLKKYREFPGYSLTAKNVYVGESLAIGDSVFNASSITKPGITGKLYQNVKIVEANNKFEMEVFREIGHLIFECKSLCSDIEIVLNGKTTRLESYDYNTIESRGFTKYIVDLPLTNAGLYSINVYAVNENRKRRIFKEYLALDLLFDIKSEKLDDQHYEIDLKSNFIPQGMKTEINIRDFKEDCIVFRLGGLIFSYIIPFEFDIYRLDDSRWFSLSEMIWIKDIKSDTTLDIYGSDLDEMCIISSNGDQLGEVIPLKNKGVFKRIDIGHLLSYRATYDYLLLVFMKEGIQRKVTYCYNKCIWNEQDTYLTYDPLENELEIMPCFYGKGRVLLKIFDIYNNIIYQSENFNSGEIIKITDLESFKSYKFCFYEKEKGLSLKKERILFECNETYYALDDLQGKSFKLQGVYFDQYVRGEFLRKQHHLNRTYIEFNDRSQKDIFIGNIYRKTPNGKELLDGINPISIQICSDVLEHNLELAITKDGDGLLLDFEKHSIKETLDDLSATDIFSYTINMKEVCR